MPQTRKLAETVFGASFNKVAYQVDDPGVKVLDQFKVNPTMKFGNAVGRAIRVGRAAHLERVSKSSSSSSSTW